MTNQSASYDKQEKVEKRGDLTDVSQTWNQ